MKIYDRSMKDIYIKFEQNVQNIIPEKIGNLPEYVVDLGLMRLTEFLIYSASDQDLNLHQLASKLNMSMQILIHLVIELSKRRIISLKWMPPEESVDVYREILC